MFQVLDFALIAIMILSMIAIAVVLYFPILLVRPFDYRKVSYRVGALSILFAVSSVAMMMLNEDGSQITLNLALFWLAMAAIMIGFMLIFSYFVYRGLRSLSATFAQREERIAEQKRQRQREHAGDAPTEA